MARRTDGCKHLHAAKLVVATNVGGKVIGIHDTLHAVPPPLDSGPGQRNVSNYG
jgi:hypothetical protein